MTSLGEEPLAYEYAFYNMNSGRGIESFSVPIPFGANISNDGFHDVDYHSGEPFVGTDWTSERSAPRCRDLGVPDLRAEPERECPPMGAALQHFRFDARRPADHQHW